MGLYATMILQVDIAARINCDPDQNLHISINREDTVMFHKYEMQKSTLT